MIVLVPAGAARMGALLALDETEAHHLRVRRMVDGGSVELRDGAGLVGDGRVLVEGKRVTVEVTAARVIPPPTPLRLAVGAGDKDRFGWLAEKAAELGVTELVPLETERTRGVADRLRAGQVDRLRRRAREAIKQSGAAWAPEIADPVALPSFAAHLPDGLRWLADIDGAVPGATGGSAATAVIGPEGGLAPAERELLVAAGFQPVRLAAHVLRFETAAIAAAVLIGFGRLGGPHG